VTAVSPWPTSPADLELEQERLGRLAVEPWRPREGPLRVAACAVVFGRGGRDEVGWTAAVVHERSELVAASRGSVHLDVPFEPGWLALREGPILEAAVRRLPLAPDILVVAAAGRDHPRRAGLALHLGAVLDLPTVGVTDEPLRSTGEEPARGWGSRTPLTLGGEVVAYRLRTRGGAKPVVAHAGWRTSAEVAAEVVLGSCVLARWPEPLREARRIARELRNREG
jgi:deoxyribonuclease V